MSKPDLPHYVFEGKIHKYILTGAYAATRYKVAIAPRPKSEYGRVALEAICNEWCF